MAATYTIVRQYPDTEYIGGTQTRPVTAVGYLTVPYSIYFESRIPDSSFTTEERANTGKVNSEPLIAVRNIPGVTDVEWTQITRPSGYIQDEIIVYYQTPSANSASSLTVPFTGISATEVKPLVDAAITNLEDGENL